MAFDFCNIIISGRLIKDAEIKTINIQGSGERHLTTFVIANNYRRKENEANFIECYYWSNNVNDFIHDRLKKGVFVVLNGYLKQEKWISKNDNSNRSKIIIVVTNFLSFEFKNMNPQSGSAPRQGNSQEMEKDYTVHQMDDFGDGTIGEPNFDDGFDEDSNNLY